MASLLGQSLEVAGHAATVRIHERHLSRSASSGAGPMHMRAAELDLDLDVFAGPFDLLMAVVLAFRPSGLFSPVK